MKQRFILHKLGDQTRENVLRNIHAAVDALDAGKVHCIEIGAYRAPRSNDANAYLWAVPYPLIVRALGFTSEEWHEEFCIRYFGKRVVQKPGGRTEDVPLRTTTTNEEGERDVVSSQVFWDFVELVRRTAAEAGVYIPEPDPFWRESRGAFDVRAAAPGRKAA